MTGERVGVAVVGTGFGCLTHVRTLQAAGLDVIALVGRDDAKTRDRAARFGVPHPCTSLADALALDGVDAVTVATPPHTHAALVLEAVAAGKHVVCEKPFARDAAEAQTMLDAASAAGVVHLLGTEFRFATGQALARRAILAGAIGEPKLALSLLHLPLLADATAEVPAWWGDASQGGGWLGAQGSHVLDQMRDLFGPVAGVSASLPRLSGHDWTADDTFSIRFRSVSGVDGLLSHTAGDRGPIVGLTRFVGTEGTLWVEGDAVSVADASGARVLDVPPDLAPLPPDPPPADLMVTAYDWLHSTGIDFGPYTRLFSVFRDRILGRPVPDDPRPATFADGVAGMALLDAVRRSAADGGGWIAPTVG